MYSALFTLATKYGSKVLMALTAFLFLAGLYWYWEHKIYSEGYDKAEAKYLKIQADADRQSAELLKLKNEEIKNVRVQHYKEREAIRDEYAKNNAERIRVLTTDYNKRLRVKAKCPSSGNSLPASPDIPGGNNQGRESFDFAELAIEDSRALRDTAGEVDKMSSICKQALDFIEQNGMSK